MRLKKLIVQGFKSFADRTEFVFDAPITGIVGPNGCGKSNVVDAFKWVLGEQSAKSLRGDAMMDVIFNGSGGRKPAGMSEVTLVFDNPLRAEGGRMLSIDADEVSVGRRLFRDGASEYRVNNTLSRLKDVRELFLDTGVGVDAYSVIEQGRVSALLEANPEERRIIFEEAAGISKFKQKRKETERRLEKVDQNLLRVTDIVEEVEKRLRSVKVQAGRARTFQEHSTRLRELRLAYALREYHLQHGQQVELESRLEDARFRLDDATTDAQRHAQALEERRAELARVSERRQSNEYELVQARASLQSARQREEYASRQLQQIAEQLAGFEHDQREATQKHASVQAALSAETASLDELTRAVQTHQSEIEKRHEAHRDGQLKLNQLNQQVEGHKSAILGLMRQLAGVNSRLGAIEIECKNTTAQQGRLEARRQAVVQEQGELDQQRQAVQAELDSVAALIVDRQVELDARRAEAVALGRQVADLSEQLGKAREHRSGLVSRQKLLKDLEAKREGVSEGVKAVLRQRGDRFGFIRGLVADVLRVDVEHAHVVEAALDGRDQWLLADSAESVLANGESLQRLDGRVNIICLGMGANAEQASPMPPVERDEAWPAPARLVSELVRCDADYQEVVTRLLGRTVWVQSLDEAIRLAHDGPSGFRYVTTRGEVVEADGVVRAGPPGAAMGLLSRRSELDATARQLEDVDQRIESLGQQVADGNTQSKALTSAESALRNEIYQTNTRKVELNSQISRTNDKQSALRREQPVLESELAQLAGQFGRLESEAGQLNEQRERLNEEQTSHQSAAQEMSSEHSALNESLKAVGEELTSARIRLGQAQEKQLSSRQQVQRYGAQCQEILEQIQRMTQSAQALNSKRDQAEQESLKSRDEQRQLDRRIAELTQYSATLSEQSATMAQAAQEVAAQLKEAEERHGELSALVHELELKASELRVRLDGLVQRTRDELELDLPQRYEELHQGGEGGSPATGYVPQEQDWDAVADEIRTLREKIQRLGNVNLDAIGEQDELEQRQQFLASQVADLTDSKQQLQALIATINTESGLRFEQTFNAVREHFQTMFRKLFGGGKADIFLETEVVDKKAAPVVGADGQVIERPMRKVDILDAGIEIIARPPGKQPVSISQLSGGEKTMTCVALLLSIFKSKPSPFCILDEVDAALDEANNARFNDIVQEFLTQSQFIVITHSKRTMQIADVLYGVTMQEQGVSKRVAVKFDQVDQNGRISEPAAA